MSQEIFLQPVKIFTAKTIWLFFLLVAVLVASNVIWVIQDQSPPLWDMAGHSYRSVYYSDLFFQGHWKTIITDPISHYPPLVYLITGLGYKIFGSYQDLPQMSLLIFLVIAELSVFAITKIFTKSNLSALLASVLLALFPLSVHFSRIYDLDYPLMAMVALSFWLLLKTEYFSRLSWAIAFGLVAALGLLTKFMFPFFLGPFVVIYLLIYLSPSARKPCGLAAGLPAGQAGMRARGGMSRSLPQGDEGTQKLRGINKENNYLDTLCSWHKETSSNIKKPQYPKLKVVIKNLTVAIVFFLVITVPWYAYHYRQVLAVGQETAANEFFVKFSNLMSWENFTYYFRTLSTGLSWPMIFIFIIALSYLFYRRDKKTLFIVVGLALTYLVLSCGLYAKESRFLLPFYPFIALIIAMFINQLKSKTISTLFIICCLLFTGFFWLQTSWGLKILKTDFETWPSLFRVYGLRAVIESDPQYGYTYPTKYNTQLPELVDRILADKQARGQVESTSQVAVVPNSIFLAPNQLEFLAALKDLKDEYYQISRRVRLDGLSALDKADYVITKSGDQGPEPWALKAYEVASEEAKPEPNYFTENFQLIYQYSYQGLEQEETVRLFRRL